MNLYELIGRSVTIAVLVLVLLTMYDLAGGESSRAWQGVMAFFDAVDGVVR